MNTLWIVVIAVIVIYLAYNFYARRIDRDVIKSDAKRATPAKMYMDGVDFMPTSRNVLYGYHFKSIAAAGPIVGPITAANIWGWLPALLWLVIGVSFIGWVSDYSAIMVAVRNDGNSLSAISHKLIAPRTRTILFIFIFFYLMLLAGAFVGILAAILAARPDVPFGIIMLALMGLLAGQMMYKWKMDLIVVTAIVVFVTLGAMALGPMGQHKNEKGALVQGPVGGAIVAINSLGGQLLGQAADPLHRGPDERRPAHPRPGKDGKRPTTPAYDAATGQIKTMPELPLLDAVPVRLLVLWREPAHLALRPAGQLHRLLDHAHHHRPQRRGRGRGAAHRREGRRRQRHRRLRAGSGSRTSGSPRPGGKAWQPLWPMLFVTIACGAISGWHCARRLGRHGPPARVRDRRASGRRRVDVRREHAGAPLADGGLHRRASAAAAVVSRRASAS